MATNSPPPPAGGEGTSSSFMHTLQGLLQDLPGILSDRVHLLALELRRAGQALAQAVALVVALGVLACTAWLSLWVGLGVAFIQAGVPWGWVLLAVLALNLGAAIIAWRRVRMLLGFLTLPATMRRLTLPPVTEKLTGKTSKPTTKVPADEYATADTGERSFAP